MAHFLKIAPFSPGSKATVTLAVTASTGNVQVEATEIYHAMILYNAGTKDCFIELGETNAVTASATQSMPLKAGASRLVIAAPYVAAICGGTDSTTLWVTPGDGGGGVIA
jgi:hypothetical protein